MGYGRCRLKAPSDHPAELRRSVVKTWPSRPGAQPLKPRGGKARRRPVWLGWEAKTLRCRRLCLVGLVMARVIAGRLLSSRRTSFTPSRSPLLTRKFSTGLTGSRNLGSGVWNRFFLFKTSLLQNPENFAQVVSFRKRWASASTATITDSDSKISIGPKNPESDEDGKDAGVVYYGPISSTIKKVKLLSLSTCCLSVSLGPVVTFLTAPEMNVILKGAVASSVIFLSASTTAALHWFVSPYVHKLRWVPGSDTFEVEMMSWLATYIPKTIRFIDVKPSNSNRPFVTFKANNNFYFIDEEHCRNKALLARLTPKGPTHESAFKNL